MDWNKFKANRRRNRHEREMSKFREFMANNRRGARDYIYLIKGYTKFKRTGILDCQDATK